MKEVVSLAVRKRAFTNGNTIIGILRALKVVDDEKKKLMEIRGVNIGKYYTTYLMAITDAIKFEDIEKVQSELELKLNSTLILRAENRLILFMVKNTQNVIQEFSQDLYTKENLLPFAYNEAGEPIYWDCTLDSNLIVGGGCNCGKTNIIAGMIALLIKRGHCDLYLSDMKYNDFNKFRDCRCVKALVNDPQSTLSVISSLLEEYEVRHKFITQEHQVADYEELIKKGIKMNRVYLFIDEFADITQGITNKNEATKVLNDLITLSRKARMVGIHLILATQRPTADVIVGAIKGNCTGRIGLRCADSITSKVIIDAGGLEKKQGIGEGIAVLAGRAIDFKGYYLDKEKAKEEMQRYKIDKVKQDINYKANELLKGDAG